MAGTLKCGWSWLAWDADWVGSKAAASREAYEARQSGLGVVCLRVRATHVKTSYRLGEINQK